MMRSPPASTISIRPIDSGVATGAAGGASAAVTVTGTSFTGSSSPPGARFASWRRHVNNRLALTP
jgi:hypothetical protein